MLFDPKSLEDIADSDIYRRGRDYYLDGAVSNVTLKRNDRGELIVRGNVEGTETYETTLTLDEEHHDLTSYECSCPYHFSGACKHVVALGLAALPLSPDGVAPGKKEMSEALRAMATKRNVDLSAEDVDRLSEKLLRLRVGVGEAPLSKGKRPPRIEDHTLEGIKIALAYDVTNDVLSVEAKAYYGPLSFAIPDERPLHEFVETRNDREVWHVAERDRTAERECERLVSREAFLIDRKGEPAWNVKGDDIYWFLKDTLPELEFRYEMTIDPSVEPLMRHEVADIGSDWSTKTGSGIDWFSFSVDWHCRNVKLKSSELERMIAERKPYVRGPDGAFIEYGNVEEVERLVEFLKSAKQQADGSFRSKLFFAPELVQLLRRSEAARLESTQSAFKTLQEEVERGKPVEPVVLPKHLDERLRSYQKDGVAWGMFLQKYHFGGILADDMGLGKTVQVLALLSLARAPHPGPSLVICPKTLLFTWANEAAKFTPELRVLVIDGTPPEREKLVAKVKDYDLVITSYSLLQRDLKSYAKTQANFVYVILDEAQYIKNMRTSTAQSVKLIPCQYRLALTGTPLENGVHELWSIYDFLMPGLLGDAKHFRYTYERPIHDREDKAALDQLRTRVRPFLLRRTKSSALKDLPPKIEQLSECALSPEQLVVYSRTLAQVREDVMKAVETKGFKRSHIEILSALMKLRRICDHPALADKRLPRTEELSGKMAHALELIREAVSGGHKVLLFSQFTSMLDILREALDREKIGHCTIEGKTRNRDKEVRRFCDEASVSVFLLSLKAGGTGLTLTAADTVILFDPWWNPQVEKQAMDRAHRIGQNKIVNVYKIVTKNTIEEKVMALQERKQKIFDALMQENAAAIAGLSWDDVKGLFG